jgi:phenylpropionate dioxygenase-like ring-hydroxylating dioxygenase large terminal subunit
VCPFHGRRIGLDVPGDDGFGLRGYTTLASSGFVFVLFDDALDHGFADFFRALDSTHYLVPGFTLTVRTQPEIVIENALDQRHFAQVHGVADVPSLQIVDGRDGELAVRARLQTPNANPWQEQNAEAVELRISIFSPNLCVTEIAGRSLPTYVITAATVDGQGECRIRVSVAAPPDARGSAPDSKAVSALLRDSRAAIEQDAEIWRHLAPGCTPLKGGHVAPGDELVAEYYSWCRRFHRD